MEEAAGPVAGDGSRAFATCFGGDYDVGGENWRRVLSGIGGGRTVGGGAFLSDGGARDELVEIFG